MRNRFQRQPPKHAVTARLHLAEGITKRAGARHGSGHCPTLFIDIHPCGPAPAAGNAQKRPMRPSHTARFVRQNDRFWQVKRPALQCTETQVVGQRGTDVNIILQKQMPHTPPQCMATGLGLSKLSARKSFYHANFYEIFANFAIVEFSIQPLPNNK